MSTEEEEIKKKIGSLLDKETCLWDLVADDEDNLEFGTQHQAWYTKAKIIVATLAFDKLPQFLKHYSIDLERKSINADNYVIQDYVKGIVAPKNTQGKALWDRNYVIKMRIKNQMKILACTRTRFDNIPHDEIKHLFTELQDKELEAAYQLLKTNPRDAGASAGVVLECHLKCMATNRQINLNGRTPTIPDLNDSLKEKGVYGTTVWRKIQQLDVLRNKCSDQTGSAPTEDEVRDLIDGVDRIIKTVV